MFSFDQKLLITSILVRITSAFMQRTWFVPDEHWQSLEVAHKFVFGYGYLTWEWKIGIRSYLYPLVISFIFKILQLLQIDSVYVITLFPRLFHAILAVINDVYIYRFAYEEFGKSTGLWTAFLNLSSWFLFYTMSRTLINSVETTLITVSTYYFFKWSHMQNYRLWPIKFVFFAAIAVMVRPTAAIPLLPLVFSQARLSRQHIFNIQQCYFVLGLVIFTVTIIVDRICFGMWVIVPYNFLKFNLVHGIGSFYGSHPWYWYCFQGLPTVLGIQFIPTILGALKMKKHLLTLVIAWTIFVYSLLGHKEFRFILPIVPLSMCLAGYYCSKYLKRYLGFVIISIIFTNGFPAVYFSMLHQRGPIDVMYYLANQANRVENKDISVLYLMPCHSTPYYSHIHKNISMRFLSCEPQLENQYITDEAEVFYRNPETWLASYLNHNYPSHIVFYDVLLKDVKNILKQHKFANCQNLFHAQIGLEGRIGRSIFVYCKNLSFHQINKL